MGRNTTTPANFGQIVSEILKELMQVQGLDTKDVANRLPSARSSVYSVIDGRARNPSFYHVYDIVTKGLEFEFQEFAALLQAREFELENDES